MGEGRSRNYRPAISKIRSAIAITFVTEITLASFNLLSDYLGREGLVIECDRAGF